MFLLDTDHLGIIQRESGREFPVLMARLHQCSSNDLYVSIVNFHEQLAGWQAYLKRAKSSDRIVRAYAMFEQILEDFTVLNVLSFDNPAASAFDELRASGLRRIGTMDLRIAAVALSRKCTVLSRNTVDFARVPGLVVDDWTK